MGQGLGISGLCLPPSLWSHPRRRLNGPLPSCEGVAYTGESRVGIGACGIDTFAPTLHNVTMSRGRIQVRAVEFTALSTVLCGQIFDNQIQFEMWCMSRIDFS